LGGKKNVLGFPWGKKKNSTPIPFLGGKKLSKNLFQKNCPLPPAPPSPPPAPCGGLFPPKKTAPWSAPCGKPERPILLFFQPRLKWGEKENKVGSEPPFVPAPEKKDPFPPLNPGNPYLSPPPPPPWCKKLSLSAPPTFNVHARGW